jgi:hypothetical protein
MEILLKIFEHLTDQTKKVSTKVVLAILTFFILLICDNTFNFSTNFNNQYKIEQIERLNNIVIDITLSKSEMNRLLEIRNSIIEHRTLKEKGYNFLSTIKINNDDLNKIYFNSTNISLAYILHFVSSSWAFLLLIVGFPFVAFKDKYMPNWKILTILIFVQIALFFLSWCFAKMLSYLQLFENPFFNYTLNASIQGAIFYVFVKKYDIKSI